MFTVWYLQLYQTMVITSLVVSLVPVASLHQTADIFKFLKNKLSADSINSVIHILYADNPPSMENSINIIDGADQQQKKDVI